MQHQHPLCQHPMLLFLILLLLPRIFNIILIISTVAFDEHFQRPAAFGILSPALRGHEGPLDEAVGGISIIRAIAEDQRPEGDNEEGELHLGAL